MKILLMEDNPGDARLIQEALWGAPGRFTINVAERLADGLNALHSESFDVVLLDLSLPDSRGLETLEQVQKRFSHVPVVILTASDDNDLAIRSVQMGAQDYLVKGQSDGILLRRVMAYAIERKKADLALERIAREWEATFNCTSDMVFTTDNSFRILRCNTAFTEALGTKPSEVVGKRCYEVLHRTDGPVSYCPRPKVLETRKPARSDVFEPGLGAHLDMLVSPMFDSHGEAIGMVHSIRDITERKQWEEVLSKTNRALKALSECNQALVRSTDESQLLGDVCRVIVEHGGYRLSWVGFAEQDAARTVRPVSQHGFEDGYLHTLKLSWADTDEGSGPIGVAIREGKPCAVRDILTGPTCLPWHDEAAKLGCASMLALPLIAKGQTFGVLNIYDRKQDAFDQVQIDLLFEMASDLAYGIMARRTQVEHDRAEESLRVQKELTDRILASTPNLVLVIDRSQHIVLANRAFRRMFGVTRADSETRLVTDILPLEGMSEAIGRVLSSRKAESNLEFIHKGNAGEAALVGQILPMRRGDEEKEQEGEVLLILRDVTLERATQLQLYHTAALASIGELASGIAHELNNPLTSVIGFSSLLLSQDLPDEVKSDLKTISEEAQRTAEIVRNLLTFARKQPAEKQSVDINEIVNRVLQLRAYEHRLNNVEVITRLSCNLPEVIANASQLQQVFLNIVVNAEYFMAEAHHRGTLTVVSEQAGGMVRVTFADDGPGIRKEHLGRLFSPFFTTKPVGKGTGIGLGICHGIITEHGGRIYAQPDFGKGATFIVELPVATH